ncbi:MAG: hypothetical protein Q9Q13_08305 [Acidobacteriota bacterium]|nr:hypothetical protein [Acidobacteriota bacterium]
MNSWRRSCPSILGTAFPGRSSVGCSKAPPDDRRPLRLTVAGWGLEAKTLLAERARALGAEVLALAESGRTLEILADRVQLEVLARSDRLLWVDPQTPSETDMDLLREDSGRVWIENDAGTCGQGFGARCSTPASTRPTRISTE